MISSLASSKTSLTALDIGKTSLKIDGKWLKTLVTFKNLTHLALTGIPMDSSDGEFLAAFPKLEFLVRRFNVSLLVCFIKKILTRYSKDLEYTNFNAVRALQTNPSLSFLNIIQPKPYDPSLFQPSDKLPPIRSLALDFSFLPGIQKTPSLSCLRVHDHTNHFTGMRKNEYITAHIE